MEQYIVWMLYDKDSGQDSMVWGGVEVRLTHWPLGDVAIILKVYISNFMLVIELLSIPCEIGFKCMS